MATALGERFGGAVPTDLEDLVTIPGVGRKTGNVVRSVGVRPTGPAGRHTRPAGERQARTPGRVDADRAARRGEGGIRVERPRSRRRERHVQPPDDPARPGDMCCSKTTLQCMPVGRFLPVGTVNGAGRRFPTPFKAIRVSQDEIGIPRGYSYRRNRFPPPGSKRVEAGIRLLADSPNAGLRAGIGVFAPGGSGYRPLVLLEVLPSGHGHQAFGLTRRRGGGGGRVGRQARRGVLQRLALIGRREATSSPPGTAGRGGVGG